jgi:hypothetical protein
MGVRGKVRLSSGIRSPRLLKLLPVPRRSIPREISFSLADERPALGPAVPALASEMIDAGWQVQPNHDVGGAVLLGLLLGRVETEWFGRVGARNSEK